MTVSIELTCIECGTHHRVNRKMAGRRMRCPQCDTVVHVPELDDMADDSADSHDVEAEIVELEPNQQELVDVEPFEVETVEVEAVEMDVPVTSDATPSFSDSDDDDDDDQVLVRTKRPEEEMDMTPMVDVTFLLLIFFMVTAAFSMQKSIEMPRQQTDAPSINVEDIVEDLDVVEVQIDEFGSFLVMAPEWERETPGKQNLITALREAISGANDGMRLIVKVHEMAKLRALVDAMDAGTMAGYSELEVKQVEEFD